MNIKLSKTQFTLILALIVILIILAGLSSCNSNAYAKDCTHGYMGYGQKAKINKGPQR